MILFVKKSPLLACCYCFLGGCGMVQKLAISTTVGPTMERAAKEIERESNWQTFRGSILGNLKLVEGMLYLAPRNQALQAQALKAHSAYAFGVLETQMMQNPKGGAKELALQHYSKAIYWGLSYLQEEDVSYSQLQRAHRDGKLQQLLDDRLGDGEREVEVVFFLAQSIGGYSNLQRTSPMAVAQLPLVKGMFDWVCMLRPDIRYGSCALFYGAWEVARPKMLGGDPVKGKRHFQQAMAKYPENYLIRVAYLRFYVIPYKDQRAYHEQKDFLQKAFRQWRRRFLWPPTHPKHYIQHYQDDRNLYNAIAQEQFAILKENL